MLWELQAHLVSRFHEVKAGSTKSRSLAHGNLCFDGRWTVKHLFDTCRDRESVPIGLENAPNTPECWWLSGSFTLTNFVGDEASR